MTITSVLVVQALPQTTSRVYQVCVKWLQGSPAHILGVRSIGHTPVIDMKTLTELRGTWLLMTHTALTLTRVKVLQDSTKRPREISQC